MTSKTSAGVLVGVSVLLVASVVVQPSTGHATTINSTIHGFTADNVVPLDGLGDQANAFTVEVRPNGRGIIEFNIFGLGPVSSATLTLPVTFNNLVATRSFDVLGYTGDGALTPNDYELPASPTSIGSFTVTPGAFDPVHVDVAAFINAQIALNADFAGFKVVSNSLVNGEVIDFGDTTPGHIPISATLDVTAAATPLPAALPLFASGIGALGLFGWRRKRKTAALAA